ncbi:hypothetical protein BJQ89_02379 [Arthrobacter sp. ES1]|nr:hypothetical protein [Arthrobacter sp. ES1]
MVGDVKDGGAQPCHRGHRQPEHHVADVADQGEGQQPLNVVLGQCTQDSDNHCQQGGHHQRCIKSVAREEQRFGTDNGVDTHLGEQSCEHRGDWSRRRGVGVREPKGQREHRRLDAKRHQEHYVQQVLGALVQLRQLDGEISHVDGAGSAIDHRDRHQEEHRGHHRDHQVGHACPDPRARPAEGHQHIAGGQEDLEAHIQVEQVTGEERIGHPRYQDQIGGVEDRDRRIPIAVGHALTGGVNQHGEAHR